MGCGADAWSRQRSGAVDAPPNASWAAATGSLSGQTSRQRHHQHALSCNQRRAPHAPAETSARQEGSVLVCRPPVREREGLIAEPPRRRVLPLSNIDFLMCVKMQPRSDIKAVSKRSQKNAGASSASSLDSAPSSTSTCTSKKDAHKERDAHKQAVRCVSSIQPISISCISPCSLCVHVRVLWRYFLRLCSIQLYHDSSRDTQ